MLFFIIFLIIPLIEIALFMSVGEEIGLVSTLLLCVVTAAIGGTLIRHQGLATLFSLQNTVNNGQLPLQTLFDGLCLAIAGALLLTPGFFTDSIGFFLLVPPARVWLFSLLKTRFEMKTMMGTTESKASYSRHETQIIEAEFERVPDSDDEPDHEDENKDHRDNS